MGLFTKDIKSMEDLFLHTLQDVYYAENQIVKSLPKMIEKATNRELASGLRTHLAETEHQVSRLEQVFKALGESPKGTDCPAIDGLIKEADDVAGEVDDKKVIDAAIIGRAQAIEHLRHPSGVASPAFARRAWQPSRCRHRPVGAPQRRVDVVDLRGGRCQGCPRAAERRSAQADRGGASVRAREVPHAAAAATRTRRIREGPDDSPAGRATAKPTIVPVRSSTSGW